MAAAEQSDATSTKTWLVRGGIVVAVVVAGFAVVSVMRSFLQTGEAPKQIVHNISLIKQPPPPPPKPPDKPPEPPKVKEEVQVKQPDQAKPDKPADDKPPSDKPLALDAAPGAGADGFNIGSRPGGADITSGGGGGAFYTGLLQRTLYEALMRDKSLRGQSFQVVVMVEIDGAGKITSSKFVSHSGNTELDERIQAALADVPALKEVPPPQLRHEVEIRLSNRA